MRWKTQAPAPQAADAGQDSAEDADAEDLADIDRVLAGDAHAYAALVGRHGPAIARQMRHYSADPLVIEELANDVFVEAYFGLAGFRRLAPFRHWLARIATRTGYRHWKSLELRKREVPFDETDGRAADAPVDPETATDIVYELLSELPDNDRIVLTLMYLEDCGHREIAERMGWNAAAVAMRVLRAKRRLRKIGQSEKWRERLAWIS